MVAKKEETLERIDRQLTLNSGNRLDDYRQMLSGLWLAGGEAVPPGEILG